jgi:AraC-like DNA-binding protein
VSAVNGDGTGDVVQLHLVTTDPERATETFRQAFPGIELHAMRDGPSFRFDYRRTGDGRVTANRLSLDGAAEGRGSVADVIAVGRARQGRFGLVYGREEIDTSLPYLRPTGPSTARMENVVLELLELDPTAFAIAASQRLEGSGQVVHPPFPTAASPTSPALATTWQRISDYAADAVFDHDAFASPLIRASVFDLLVSGLLATFLLTEQRSADGFDVHPATIRRALAYIDDHLADPIDVVQIAAAARLSVRGLQTGFRRHLGVTPMEHVRLRRLAAVHDELARADGTDGLTVAATARRWGFAHLGRFAWSYRTIYGESPSQTLRR